MFTALLLTLFTPPAAAQTWPAGDTLDEAIAAHLTKAGLESAGDAVPALFPDEIPVGDQSDSDSVLGCDYSYSLSDMWVSVEVDDLRLVPRQNVLDVEADLTISVNDAFDTFTIAYDSCLTGSDSCDGYVLPFPAQVQIPFTMAVVDDGTGTGTNAIDVTMGTIGFTHGLTNNNNIQLQGCAIGTVEQVLNIFGFSLFNLIIDALEPVIPLVIESQRADLEAMLEDALNQARFDDVVDLGGVDLEVMIQPHAIDISPDGLDIAMEGRLYADQGECMVARDPGGSLKTVGLAPDIASHPAGTEMMILASDDFSNQALYAIWRSGLMCFDLSEGGDIDLGFPINSSLLGIFGGEGYEELFPETQPLDILVNPNEPPVVDYAGVRDVGVILEDFGIDMYTAVDYRQARAIGITIDTVDAGIDLDFDGNTGELALDPAIEPGVNLVPVATMVELVAGSEETVQQNFTGILEVIMDQMLGDILAQLTFPIPSFDGVGLSSLTANPTGSNQDWLGVAATVGPVTYTNGGCDGNGCDSQTGCDTGTGCSTASAQALWLFAFGMPFVLLRRRRAA